jgi:hypothetical protein
MKTAFPDWHQTVNLEYCGVEGTIAVMKDQYAVGTVTAKIIQPKPGL